MIIYYLFSVAAGWFVNYPGIEDMVPPASSQDEKETQQMRVESMYFIFHYTTIYIVNTFILSGISFTYDYDFLNFVGAKQIILQDDDDQLVPKKPDPPKQLHKNMVHANSLHQNGIKKVNCSCKVRRITLVGKDCASLNSSKVQHFTLISSF